MTKRGRTFCDFFAGFATGFLITAAVAALTSELAHVLRSGQLGEVFEVFPVFDETFGGDRIQVADEDARSQVITHSQGGEDSVRDRRLYRERTPPLLGGGDQAVYYDEE